MKFLIYILLSMSVALAQPFKVNDTISNFSLPDQFDEKQTITHDIKLLLVSFEKSTGANVNAFLAQKSPDFLQRERTAFIANISGMPMIITKMFALPKMRGYPHKILLIYDDKDDRFIHKEGKTTLYRLNNGVIENIEYITEKSLSKVFE